MQLYNVKPALQRSTVPVHSDKEPGNEVPPWTIAASQTRLEQRLPRVRTELNKRCYCTSYHNVYSIIL